MASTYKSTCKLLDLDIVAGDADDEDLLEAIKKAEMDLNAGCTSGEARAPEVPRPTFVDTVAARLQQVPTGPVLFQRGNAAKKKKKQEASKDPKKASFKRTRTARRWWRNMKAKKAIDGTGAADDKCPDSAGGNDGVGSIGNAAGTDDASAMLPIPADMPQDAMPQGPRTGAANYTIKNNNPYIVVGVQLANRKFYIEKPKTSASPSVNWGRFGGIKEAWTEVATRTGWPTTSE